MKRYIALVTLMLTGGFLMAQDTSAAPASNDFFSDLFVKMIVISAAVVMMVAILVLYRLLMTVIKVEQIKIYKEQGMDAYLEASKKPKQSWVTRLYKSWTAAVPLEKEADVLLLHDYDGIYELDNKLPPWWVAMFYLSIVFAGVYLFYYHVSDMGMSQLEEYEAEMAQGEEQVAEFLAKQANLIDESNVELLTDEKSLAAGKAIFDANCVACHGQFGEGTVGPNMTDNYWIHGGSITDVFKTIKYGVPEKGMISWQTQLRPADMHAVGSYILTLQGTNPPNPKAAEGDLYEPAGSEGTPTEDAPAQGESNSL